MPVTLPALPPDTSARQVSGGSLILNASTHTWMYWYVTRNSRGFVMDSESQQGLFTQSGSTLELTIQLGATPLQTVVAQVLSDRIITTGCSPEMEWQRPSN